MQPCFPRTALGALCAASALLLSACGGDDGPAPDPSLVEVVRPTDQPCAIVASTPASGAVNAAVNVETTVIYTGPRAGACRDLRLTDAAGDTVPTDTLVVNEWAHPDGGIVGTVSLQPKADLRPASDFTVVRGQERLLSFRAGSTRAGLPVSAIDQPVHMTGLPQSSLIPATQINRVLDMLALDLADGNEIVAQALDWALSQELKRLAAPGATYSARVKKLVYTSVQADGSPIQLSGLMVLPVQADGNAPDYSRSPVMVGQRGTQTNSAAPPSSAAQLASLLPGLLAAGKGHIYLVPDLIGVGDTAHLPQAYLVTKDTAAQTRDMLLAARTYIQQTYGTLPDKALRIMGISQGGHSAMAALPQLARLGSVKLVSAMAGPYDVQRTFSSTLNAIAGDPRDTYAAHEDLGFAPRFLAGSLEALGAYQHYNYQPNRVFAADGTLLTSFLAEFKAGRYGELKAHWGASSMASNTQRYIAPDAKVVLYHFSTDTRVPAQNTVDMLARLKNGQHQLASVERGSCRENSALTQLVLQLSDSPLKTHTVCVVYQIDDLIAEL